MSTCVGAHIHRVMEYLTDPEKVKKETESLQKGILAKGVGDCAKQTQSNSTLIILNIQVVSPWLMMTIWTGIVIKQHNQKAQCQSLHCLVAALPAFPVVIVK